MEPYRHRFRFLSKIIETFDNNNIVSELRLNATVDEINIDDILNTIEKDSNLKKLELTNLGGKGLKYIFKTLLNRETLAKISILNLYGSRISAKVPLCEYFTTTIWSISSLNLSRCNLSSKMIQDIFDAFQKSFGMSMAIEYLDISYNYFNDGSNRSFQDWILKGKGLLLLKYLNVSTTGINPASISVLNYLPSLEGIDISSNYININEDFSIMLDLPKFHKLNISYMMLKPQIISMIFNSISRKQIPYYLEMRGFLFQDKHNWDNFLFDLTRMGHDYKIKYLDMSGIAIDHVLFIQFLEMLATIRVESLNISDLRLHLNRYNHTIFNDSGVCYSIDKDGGIKDRLLQFVSMDYDVENGFTLFRQKLITCLNKLFTNQHLFQLQMANLGKFVVGISKSIGENHHLTHLDISGNNIPEEELAWIYKSLQRNTKLNVIKFDRNEITMNYQLITNHVSPAGFINMKQFPIKELMPNDRPVLCGTSINHYINCINNQQNCLTMQNSGLIYSLKNQQIPQPHTISPFTNFQPPFKLGTNKIWTDTFNLVNFTSKDIESSPYANNSTLKKQQQRYYDSMQCNPYDNWYWIGSQIPTHHDPKDYQYTPNDLVLQDIKPHPISLPLYPVPDTIIDGHKLNPSSYIAPSANLIYAMSSLNLLTEKKPTKQKRANSNVNSPTNNYINATTSSVNSLQTSFYYTPSPSQTPKGSPLITSYKFGSPKLTTSQSSNSGSGGGGGTSYNGSGSSSSPNGYSIGSSSIISSTGGGSSSPVPLRIPHLSISKSNSPKTIVIGRSGSHDLPIPRLNYNGRSLSSLSLSSTNDECNLAIEELNQAINYCNDILYKSKPKSPRRLIVTKFDNGGSGGNSSTSSGSIPNNKICSSPKALNNKPIQRVKLI